MIIKDELTIATQLRSCINVLCWFQTLAIIKLRDVLHCKNNKSDDHFSICLECGYQCPEIDR